MENSKILLERAVAALAAASIKEDQWAVGGGTVLAAYYNHRLSKDIDIFINDAQYLAELSPRFNEECESALDYDEMSNYISLSFPEGKIDFIAAGQISGFKPHKGEFFGKLVMLEDPVEIVGKKLYFRNNHILPRDLFDLAVVYDSSRHKDLIAFALTIPQQMDIFIDTFEKNKNVLQSKAYSLMFKSALLEGGKAFIGREIALCQQFIDELQRR